jgi:nucleoside-diphosphate-sugar epimerase
MRHDLYVKSMVEAAAAGRDLALPSGAEMKRDYLYIKDAVQGTLAALDAEPDSLRQRVFNIASGEIVTTKQLADLVGELSGAKISVGAGLSDFERNDIRTRGRVDISAAKRDLGYVPEFNLRKGVSTFLDSARSDIAKNGRVK